MATVIKKIEYLKKNSKCRIIIDTDKQNYITDAMKLKPDFGHQYCEFEEKNRSRISITINE